ncbi:MAG: L-serine ammonia-lyase, iron-sulfur-dependent, subunit alpha [Ruthenibacterium lactatiformans]
MDEVLVSLLWSGGRAASGAGAATSWLKRGDYNAHLKQSQMLLQKWQVASKVMGAGAMRAAKIASAVDAAIMAYALEDADHCFQAGEGLVRDNVEDTIRNMGYAGRAGMKDTDVKQS